MRTIFLKLVALLSILFAQMVSAEGDTFRFVGAPLSAALDTNPCTYYVENPESEVCLDRAFLLRYKVIQVIEGTFSEPEIEFIGFWHNRGLPLYVTEEPVYLSLSKYNGIWKLKKIADAHKSEGIWLSCGGIYPQSCDEPESLAPVGYNQ